MVRDHAGIAVAAVGIGHLTKNLSDERLPELVQTVIEQAKEISDALGGALGTLAPPRLEVQVTGAIEPPVPPVPWLDTPAGKRASKQSRAGG